MRMMLRYTIPAEGGNEGAVDGSLDRARDALVETLRPEAAYYWVERGERAGLMVFDMDDTSRIPELAEPLFMAARARAEFIPVMNGEELATGLARMSKG